MNHSLRVALCHSATARAHLAGAEAARWDALPIHREVDPEAQPFIQLFKERAAAARRRYWREVSAVQLLMGHRWPEAEALGVEPQ